jgi:hypothetical protein
MPYAIVFVAVEPPTANGFTPKVDLALGTRFVVELDRPANLGSGPHMEISIPASTMHRRHAHVCLVRDADRVVLQIRDFNNTNPTFVHGNRLDGTTAQIRIGERFSAGGAVLELRQI